MNQGTLDRLSVAREFADTPFVLKSAVRCIAHNKAVGGVDSSAHVMGHAVDIQTTGSASRFKILRGLLVAGFTRIGIGDGFIHADDDPEKPGNVVWAYYK